jgi:hypothetical protein
MNLYSCSHWLWYCNRKFDSQCYFTLLCKSHYLLSITLCIKMHLSLMTRFRQSALCGNQLFGDSSPRSYIYIYVSRFNSVPFWCKSTTLDSTCMQERSVHELNTSAKLQLHTSLIIFYLKMQLHFLKCYVCTHLVQTPKNSCLLPHLQ